MFLVQLPLVERSNLSTLTDLLLLPLFLEEQPLALNFGAHMTHFDLGRTLNLFSNI